MLREYQSRAIADLRSKYAAGSRSPCLVLPTGGGKTVVAAEIIRLTVNGGRRVLFAAHRTELISQSVNKLESAGITDLRVIQASNDLGSRIAPVTVASIQTLASRRWADRLPKADLLILDECHHTPAKTWARLAADYRDALLLGLTATPERADQRPLGDIFDSIVVGATVRELTDLGHLVPCRVFAPPQTLETAQIALSPVSAYLKHTAGERAVVFCVTVEHAQQVAADFRAAGITTGVVHGDMRKEDRKRTLAALASGELSVVTSIGVLTEGFDCPPLSVCILARKPQHTGLYLQCAGRVLRPSPGKHHATLIDLCGSVHDHGPPDLDREYSLTGRAISKVDRDQIRQCPTCGGVFQAGPSMCPMCGCEMPSRTLELPREMGIDVIELDKLPKLSSRPITLSITAKFPGTCRGCRGRIAVGQQIYWVKGNGARHANCEGA